MRDVNRHTLSAMVTEAHARHVWVGIAPDRLKDISSLIDRGLRQADIVLISGGSSMGSRDLVVEAIEGYDDAEILLHGVSVSPGKPLILARVGTQPVLGLPGHPVSAMVCFEQIVVPLLRHLEGEAALEPFSRPTVRALLGRNVPSREGRTDYVRVRLRSEKAGIVANPVPGKSGMISAMVRAQGIIRIEAGCEGLYKGDEVTVHLFSDWAENSRETEHIPGHEGSGRGSGDLPATSRQELLSRL
jgi:molybdopterin molybdotransferase